MTLAGMVRLTLSLESARANPPAGATPVSETVQEVLAGVLIVALVQFRLFSETVTGREIAPGPPLAGMEVPNAVVATILPS